MKSRDLQPRLFYSARLSFRTKGQIKSFPDVKKLKEFITTKPVLHELLKGLLEEEGGGGGGERRKKKDMNNKMVINTYLLKTESKINK